METTFAEELIYTYNNKLKIGDLEKLYKLSDAYDIYARLDKIFTENFCTIVNYLVLNELPYRISSKLVVNDKLINKFIEYRNDKFFVSGELFGWAVIYEHVDTINKLLQDES